MSNPLFDRFNRSQPQLPFGNLFNALGQFRQFKSQFQGDPRQKVQELLNSGQMTQEQYNQLSNMAAQLQNMFK